LVWDSQKICRCYRNLSSFWMLIGACNILELNLNISRLVSVVQRFQCLLTYETSVVQSCACVQILNGNTSVCIYTLIVTSNSFLFCVLRTEIDFFAHWHRAISSNLNRRFGWCCFYHFTKNSPVALLEALLARIFSYLSSRCIVQVSQRKTKQRKGTHPHTHTYSVLRRVNTTERGSFIVFLANPQLSCLVWTVQRGRQIPLLLLQSWSGFDDTEQISYSLTCQCRHTKASCDCSIWILGPLNLVPQAWRSVWFSKDARHSCPHPWSNPPLAQHLVVISL